MKPDFFSSPDQLFPSWPRFDAARMTALFVCAMVLLLLPKAIGLAETYLSAARRRAHGGGWRLALSASVELVLSSLYAPIMMLMQTRHVIEILAGLDSGWLAQDRAGTTLPWRKAFSAHRLHVLTGVAGIVALWFTQPEVLMWMSPVLGGLVLSPLLSRMSGDPRLEPLMARIGLCDSADARAVPAIVTEAQAIAPEIRAQSARGLESLVTADALARAHADALGPEGEPNAVEQLAAITARAKIDASAGEFRAAIDLMTRDERIAIASDGDLLARWRVARGAMAR